MATLPRPIQASSRWCFARVSIHGTRCHSLREMSGSVRLDARVVTLPVSVTCLNAALRLVTWPLLAALAALRLATLAALHLALLISRVHRADHPRIILEVLPAPGSSRSAPHAQHLTPARAAPSAPVLSPPRSFAASLVVTRRGRGAPRNSGSSVDCVLGGRGPGTSVPISASACAFLFPHCNSCGLLCASSGAPAGRGKAAGETCFDLRFSSPVSVTRASILFCPSQLDAARVVGADCARNGPAVEGAALQPCTAVRRELRSGRRSVHASLSARRPRLGLTPKID